MDAVENDPCVYCGKPTITVCDTCARLVCFDCLTDAGCLMCETEYAIASVCGATR